MLYKYKYEIPHILNKNSPIYWMLLNLNENLPKEYIYIFNDTKVMLELVIVEIWILPKSDAKKNHKEKKHIQPSHF